MIVCNKCGSCVYDCQAHSTEEKRSSAPPQSQSAFCAQSLPASGVRRQFSLTRSLFSSFVRICEGSAPWSGASWHAAFAVVDYVFVCYSFPLLALCVFILTGWTQFWQRFYIHHLKRLTTRNPSLPSIGSYMFCLFPCLVWLLIFVCYLLHTYHDLHPYSLWVLFKKFKIFSNNNVSS